MDIHITEELQHILVEHIAKSDNGIAVLDGEDKLIFHNNAFVKLFGLEKHAPIGHTLNELLIWMHANGVGANTHAATIAEWLEFVRCEYRSKSFRNYEVDLLDGRWILMTEQVNAGGEVVLVCNDITSAKMTEHALRVAQKKLEKLAWTDELTGLPNRRAFMKNLNSEHQRSLRYSHPASLAIIDLDFFKKINDQYGHHAGDAVLRHFANVLIHNMRKEDIIGRIGGEEFAILLPETAKLDAGILLSRIKTILSQATIEEIGPDFKYTFSAGLTELPLDAPLNCHDWINLTDQALYQAKHGGRNQVFIK